MHVDIFEMGKAMLDKRNKEQKIAELTNNGLLDLSKVKPTHLEDAGISLRDFDLITLVAKVDAELFRPSELGSFSPFSMIVDVGKYQDRTDIPWEFKELIYRPPKLKSLYEKYWTLARLVEGKTKVEHDREILTGYKPRYPKKTPEEQQIVNKVIETI